MITADYHVHTNFSTDSDTPMEDQIKKAIDLHLDRICITDHMDYDYPVKGEFEFDPSSYLKTIDDMKDKYGKQIKILKGVELGLRPEVASRCQALVDMYPFDFIIGSTHLVDNIDPYEKEYWNSISEKEGINKYLSTIVSNIKSFQDFQVYGHIDYVVRYAPNQNKYYSYEAYKEIIDKVLAVIIDHGKGIEVNTAGYKYGLGYAHPQTDIIKRYLQMGGKIITIGSDGHKPEHLAFDFDRARNMLLELGVKEYTVFENRQPIFLPL